MARGKGGMPGNMQQMMKQAQQMQTQLAKIQEEAKFEEGEGTSGGGMVKVIATGNQEVKSIEINKEAVDPEDVEMLQDLILAAVNQALQTAQAKVQEKMSKITGGLQIPGLSL